MSLQQIKKKTDGFTIIEVLIVLAIAGLIMLIVFLAVPALQRNQRNSARDSEASKLATLASSCLANHNGEPAACLTDAQLGAVSTDFKEITTRAYANSASVAAVGSYDATTEAIVQYNRSCGTYGDVDAAGTARQFVVLYKLEPAITKCISV